MTEREWCERIWPVHVNLAAARTTITYKDLKSRIGFNGWQRTLSNCLGRIANYCHQHELPIIVAVVVNKNTGRPGHGIPFVEDFDAELERVHAFPWRQQNPPVADAFPESACKSAVGT